MLIRRLFIPQVLKKSITPSRGKDISSRMIFHVQHRAWLLWLIYGIIIHFNPGIRRNAVYARSLALRIVPC